MEIKHFSIGRQYERTTYAQVYFLRCFTMWQQFKQANFSKYKKNIQ